MGNILKLALPKGSLQESTVALMRKAGFNVRVNDRSYFPKVDDDELNITLVRAQEIPRYVELGFFDIGITGEDWVIENDADVLSLETLAYAKQGSPLVRWVVAVPEESDIRALKDISGKRVATELVRTTKAFFKDNGVDDVDVEFSWGATEVKPPYLADAIVELTETGTSLKKNRLRILADVVTSQTQIICHKKSFEDAWKRQKAEAFALLLKAVLVAEDRVGLKMNVCKKDKDAVLAVLPTMKSPTLSPLLEEGWYSLEAVLEKKVARNIVPLLKKAGACDIFEYPLNSIVF